MKIVFSHSVYIELKMKSNSRKLDELQQGKNTLVLKKLQTKTIMAKMYSPTNPQKSLNNIERQVSLNDNFGQQHSNEISFIPSAILSMLIRERHSPKLTKYKDDRCTLRKIRNNILKRHCDMYFMRDLDVFSGVVS